MIAVLLGSLAAAGLPRQSEAAAGASDAVAGANRAAATPAPKTGRVVKVLPLFLDLKGHDAISPSLFDRDAYQAFLRQHTNDISAIRFDVLWKASNAERRKIDNCAPNCAALATAACRARPSWKRKSRPHFSAVGLR